MSGTVPPPPPLPGGGPEPRDVPETGTPGASANAPGAFDGSSLPPSFSPTAAPSSGSPAAANDSGGPTLQRMSAPDSPGMDATSPSLPPLSAPRATAAPSVGTVHAPVPPAPVDATAVQPPVPSRPASYQPPTQPGQQPQPDAYPPSTAQQPTAFQPPVRSTGPTGAGQGAADWWGDQWSPSSQPQAPSYPPAPTYPPAQTNPAAQTPAPAHTYPPAQTYPAAQTYAATAQGHAQGYGQGFDERYGQGHGGDYGAPPPAYAGIPAPPPPPPPGGGTRRRRLTPGWIAFIAVDALLIVVAIIFAVQIFGAPVVREPDAGAGPASAATSEASEPADEEQAKAKPLARFASPSRNITCSILENSVTCGIAELDQQPAPVDGCSGTTGYVVTIEGADGTVSLPCVKSSDQPKAAGKKMTVLEYGESRTEGDFTCTSDKNGMQCRHDPTGSGFSLARAGIGTF